MSDLTLEEFPPEYVRHNARHIENLHYAFYFDIIVVMFFFLYVLTLSPFISSWLASGRFKQGFFLRSKNPAQNDYIEDISNCGRDDHHHEDEKYYKTPALASPSLSYATSRITRSYKPCSTFNAVYYTIYNKIFLPEIPFAHLTGAQFILLCAYTILIAYVLLTHVGDLVDNYRRSGLVSIVQIPLLIILSTKNNIASISGKGYEKLCFLHKFVGRSVILMGVLHAVLYFVHKATSVSHTITWNNTHIAGLVATGALLLIFFSSLSFVRKRFYQFFMVSHILSWPVAFAALWIHARSTRPHIIASLIFLGLDYILRVLNTRIRSATFRSAPGNCTLITVDNINDGWRAGQHCLLRIWKGHPSLSVFESHPLTICNAPATQLLAGESRGMILCAKVRGKWSTSLYKNSIKCPFQEDNEAGNEAATKKVMVIVEGPYGGPKYHDFARSQAILIVAGGSGITFALSIVEDLIGAALNGSTSVQTVLIVWSVREKDMLHAFSCYLCQLLELSYCAPLEVRLRIHHTGSHNEPSTDEPVTTTSTPPTPPPPASNTNYPFIRGQILQERANVATDLDFITSTILDTLDDSHRQDENGANIYNYDYDTLRPKSRRGGGISVAVCGPDSLVTEVRYSIAMYPWRKAFNVGGIRVFSENFAF